MTKPPRIKTINKDRRLSKSAYKKYKEYLADLHFTCQICGEVADDTHHVLFGAYKDDRTLVSLCRKHHEEAHKDKKTWERVLLPIANYNWKIYCEGVHIPW